MAQPFRATLDEIVAAVPVSAVQSASIACEVAARLDRWIRAKRPAGVVVPTLQDITITQSGSVWWWRGRSVDPALVVPAVGFLLGALLQRTPAGRTPAGLLYVVARATEAGHLAPFRDLAEMHVALIRYAAERRHLAIDALLARYQIARSGLPPLGAESSISDVRRLRRAGGVPLSQIAGDTGIPVSLLRELEWGVFTHWDPVHASATLASYAERAGLDPDAVVQVIVREQAEVSAETCLASVEEVSATPQLGFLPFAFAALLLATVMTTTPVDRMGSARIRANVVAQAPAAATTPLPVSAVTPASKRSTLPRPTPARTTSSSPSRTKLPSSADRPRVTRADSPDRPLARFARALVGDGRYRAEPFPKPKE